MTLEEIAKEFSEEVALLVDGVTKLTQLDLSQDKIEVQAENLRKMFLAMAKDIRVILIKLADRLHNLRTMQYQSPAKQIEKSRETMDIYAPLAHRLGISKIKVELDDLSMQYLYPEVYKNLKEEITTRLNASEDFIVQMVEQVGASPAAFCSSNFTLSPSLSFKAVLKPFVAASSASCCTSWQIPTVYVLPEPPLSAESELPPLEAVLPQPARPTTIVVASVSDKSFLNVFLII